VSADPIANHNTPSRRWWREWEIAALLVLVLVAYFFRADALPLRGEESTRAQIAFEMVYWHDWLIPRVQGEPFRIRPPLQNWVNAGCCALLGRWDVYAIRLPSVIATLLTTLLIYAYGRQFLTRLGALTAATAFATMADMFKMGLYAETEALFILLLGGALLIWHAGLMRGWPLWRTYAAGYGLMALATLTKGIQAPPYFIGAITVYLVLSRQWRRLVCWGHLVGFGVAALLLLAWMLPYGWVMGWPAAKEVWLGDQTVQHSRQVIDWDMAETLTHLATYPLEVIAATLPWCLLLLPYLSSAFRRRIGSAGPMVHFASCAMGVAWPTCWVPPAGLPRYFAPLFPCLAVLIGLAVERLTEPAALPALQAAWQRYIRTLALVMIAAALVVVLLAVGAGATHPQLAPLAEPLPVAWAYALTAVALAAVLWRLGGTTAPQVRLSVLALSVFLVLTFTGLVMNVRVRRSVDAAVAVERIRGQLPPAQELVSIDGQIDSLFNYLYRTPIVQQRRCPPFDGSDPMDDLTYFCFMSPGDRRPPLPFAWQEIGVVNLDRNQHPVPERVLVVGRRLPASSAPEPPVHLVSQPDMGQ
jgi:4-amino-4-deoxy-L-arabinose transferase-like glycosyltransferase